MSNFKITPDLLAAAEAAHAEEFNAAVGELFSAYRNAVKTNVKLTADLGEALGRIESLEKAQANYIPKADLELTVKNAIPANIIQLAKDEGSKAAAEALAATGSGSPVPPSPANSNAGNKPADFSAIVKANIEAGKSKSEALMAAIQSHPSEYAAARASGSFNF
jgi:hypothetical protein